MSETTKKPEPLCLCCNKPAKRRAWFCSLPCAQQLIAVLYNLGPQSAVIRAAKDIRELHHNGRLIKKATIHAG